jgi:hypothetical protein
VVHAVGNRTAAEYSSDVPRYGDGTRGVRAKLALAFVVGLALSVPASAPGIGFTRVVLMSADGRSFEVRGTEAEIDGLLIRRGSLERIRGGYLRLFFLGPGDFPANAARYCPDLRSVALDEAASGEHRCAPGLPFAKLDIV